MEWREVATVPVQVWMLMSSASSCQFGDLAESLGSAVFQMSFIWLRKEYSTPPVPKVNV